MRTYNFKKVKEIIDINSSKLSEAMLGMHEDWAWTAEQIWYNGNYVHPLPDNADELYEKYSLERETNTFNEIKDKYNNILIAGIYGSSWATPTLLLIFDDGSEMMFEVSNGCKKQDKPEYFQLGVISQEVQDNIVPLSSQSIIDNDLNEDYKKLIN